MANPNIEAAYFLVQIGQNDTNKKFRVKGSDFADVATGPEMVWVQRGDDHYWTWYGQPKDLNSPDYSYRFNYYIPPEKTQPDGDGVINVSLYFGAPGPYPATEWRNVRNAQRNFKDLDGNERSVRVPLPAAPDAEAPGGLLDEIKQEFDMTPAEYKQLMRKLRNTWDKNYGAGRGD